MFVSYNNKQNYQKKKKKKNRIPLHFTPSLSCEICASKCIMQQLLGHVTIYVCTYATQVIMFDFNDVPQHVGIMN